MGLVYYGIHEKIALAMRDKYELPVLVETGTWKGDTATWAVGEFDWVITIEVIEEYYKDSAARLAQYSNITCEHGDSREILPKLKGLFSALFWLDAHWTGHKDYKKEYGQCAALEEIAIINTFEQPHVIMVDDYALFPSMMGITPKELIDALLNNGQRRVTIEDDIFYAEPKE